MPRGSALFCCLLRPGLPRFPETARFFFAAPFAAFYAIFYPPIYPKIHLLGCRPNLPEGYYPSDSLLRFAAV